MMEKAAASAADEVFLDLEDACAPLEKPAARAKVVEALRSHDWRGKTRVVRINQVTSAFALDDLREVVTGAGGALDCIMVPKVRNAGDVAFVDRALLQLEQTLGLEAGSIGIEAQIEDAEGLMRAEEIAFASQRLETITYGPADFSASMQLPSLTVANTYNYPGDIFHYVLFKLAVAARAAGLQVIDGPYLLIRDIEGFRDAASRAAALGYDGKWVLHPGQIEPANQVFTPSQADFDKAVRILEAYKQATEVDRRGAVMLGDEMIDEASRKMAQQFVMRGSAAGLKPSRYSEEAAAG
ncbi:MAG: CoA ester lyase [Candidatus Dormibacteraeota bacterium]|nr:CoA ester lyase [Candidatus Dormibacteraeota bacterium]MBV8445572.1 CoA ester lyase [Candidatus Dormibacteraeota bacterium]